MADTIFSILVEIGNKFRPTATLYLSISKFMNVFYGKHYEYLFGKSFDFYESSQQASRKVFASSNQCRMYEFRTSFY